MTLGICTRPSSWRARLLASATAAAVSLPLLVTMPANAVEFEFGEFAGTLDTTIAAGAMFRVQNIDDNLVGWANGGTGYSVNGDDGNLNYGSHEVSAAARVTHELDINRGNFGGFLRATYFWDAINADRDSTDFRDLTHHAKDAVGADGHILDAYLYGDFDLGRVPVSVRLGKQVVNWGESTFIPNGLSVINPFDLSAIRVPGSELRNAFLPVHMVNVSVGLSENLSLEGFWQLHWQETLLDAGGTYFSTNDVVSPGSTGALLGYGNALVPDSNQTAATPVTPLGSRMPRTADDKADDHGQFGFAARYFSPGLGGTEFGAYYLNYHSRRPVVSTIAGSLTDLMGVTADNFVAGSSLQAQYPEDIQMLGLSFNTSVGSSGLSLQGEYTYRLDQPLQIDDSELLGATTAPGAVAAAGDCPAGPVCLGTVALFGTNQVIRDILGTLTPANSATLFDAPIRGYRDFNVSQAQFTATQVFGPAMGADQWALVFETGLNFVHDLPAHSKLRFEAPGATLGGNPNFVGVGGMPSYIKHGFADSTSWGYCTRIRFDFLGAIGAINLYPVLAYSHDVKGTTPLPLGTFVENRQAFSVGTAATYLDRWSAEVQYTSFFGDRDTNLIHDRDFVSLNLKFSF